MEFFSAICLGIGLSAACGFRVFIPPFLLGLIIRTEWIDIQTDMIWLGSTPALVLMGTAALVEIVAYYIPWLDNALDTLSMPMSILAGITMMAFSMEGYDPWLQWSLAVIGGGAVASTIQFFTSFLRLILTAMTAGLGNWIQSTVEAVTALLMTLISIAVPIIGMILALIMLMIIFRRLWKKRVNHSHEN